MWRLVPAFGHVGFAIFLTTLEWTEGGSIFLLAVGVNIIAGSLWMVTWLLWKDFEV